MNLSDNFRIYLRALEIEDYKTTLGWRKDPKIWSKVVGRKYFVSAENEKRWLENASKNNKEQVKLAACIEKSDRHIGNVYLTDIDWFNRKALFGILIGNKDYWNKGFGTEMTMLMLNHAFNDLGLQRVESVQLKDNLGSIKLHEKCGFKNEGTMRKAVYKNGEYRDLNLMSVIKDDFEDILGKWENR